MAKRSKAKATTDYARTNEIFDSLLREYSINIDNRAGEWALVHEEYTFNPDVSSFVPNKDVLAAIRKRLVGQRILAWKRQNFAVANNISNKLHDKYVLAIDNQNKEWKAVVPRGGRWSKDNNGEGDESNIVSREEWEEGEDEDGDASGSVDFVYGGSGAKDEDEETENDTVMMEDDNIDSGGALLSSSSDMSDEHAFLSTMTVSDCP